jgi:nitroreductase
VIALIRSRRSIRDGFVDAPVPGHVIEDIVACGLCAPSSKNAQSWRIHVVTRRSMLRELADTVQHANGADRYVPIDPMTGDPRPGLVSTVNESAEVLRRVPLGLFIESYGDFSGGRRSLAESQHVSPGMGLIGFALDMIGIGALLQSMWLAAEAHGLRGVFMGDVLVAEAEISKRLGLDGDLLGVLALGYAPHGVAMPKALAPGRVVRHS